MTLHNLIGTYRIIALAGLRTCITLTLWQEPGKGRIEEEWSHHLKTPLDKVPTAPGIDNPYEQPDEIAGRLAQALEDSISAAVKAGHTPKESWIVPPY